MISIIICSRSSELSPTYIANIKQTIGVEYEFVIVDNHDNHHNIFTAYNEGVNRAKGDILCFMHDDVALHTEAWGEKVEHYMQDRQLGILGILGSHIVPKEGDWRVGYAKYHVLSFIQRVPTYDKNPKYYTQLNHAGFNSNSLAEVAAIDGVWFCIRRELFTSGKLAFDEKTFNGFHIYDIDISMQVNALGMKIAVCDDIILEHFSEGSFNESFIDSLLLFRKKWEKELPLVKGADISEAEIRALGEKAFYKLKERIERDADIQCIKRHWKQIASGETPKPLTDSQKFILSKASFQYVKTAVKFCPSKDKVEELMHGYLADPIMQHKMLLRWKYFVYRTLHITPHKSNNTFPDAE